MLSRMVAHDVAPCHRRPLLSVMTDPRVQFACVFAALIHDVDHIGVSNQRLKEENPVLAQRYSFQSIAEQNSVDVAFRVLMKEKYKELRSDIFKTREEMDAFRQIVVSCVMATDVFVDQETQEQRQQRWNKAFIERHVQSDGGGILNTVVLELLLPSSDISHTMQHWHVYQSWNERLFREIFAAWKSGRSSTDPTEHWYAGELRFFDSYVIPLAEKLEQSAIFGVSSVECLFFAKRNRQEWEAKGAEIVDSWKEMCEAEYLAETMQTRCSAAWNSLNERN
jgi:hypothetical protein